MGKKRIYFGYMKILLSIPRSLVTRVDKYCENKGFTRSEFIRGLIRDNIEDEVKVKEVEKQHIKMRLK